MGSLRATLEFARRDEKTHGARHLDAPCHVTPPRCEYVRRAGCGRTGAGILLSEVGLRIRHPWRLVSRWGLCLTVLVPAGCAEPSALVPLDHSRRLLLPGTEAAAAIVVDVNRRAVVRRIGPPLSGQLPLFVAPSGEVVTGGRVSANETVLIGLDPVTASERWRLPMTRGGVPVRYDGVSLATTALAQHPSRPVLYMARSDRDGELGIAEFDYHAGAVTAFLGPTQVRIRALFRTLPDARDADGCLVVGADGGGGTSRRAFLWFVCGNSLAQRDSVALPGTFTQITQIVQGAGTRRIVVATNTDFFLVDVMSRQVLSRSQRPQNGPLVRLSDGSFILFDPGSEVTTTSGLVYRLDAVLELRGILDLHVLPREERPLGYTGGAVSLEGRWLYLVGGVPRDGASYGPEAARLMVVDLTTGEIRDLFPLGTVGGGAPLLTR